MATLLGALLYHTLDRLESDRLKTSLLGSFGFQNIQLQGSYQATKTLVIGYLGQMKQEGYRDYSQFENLGFNLKVKHQLARESAYFFG